MYINLFTEIMWWIFILVVLFLHATQTGFLGLCGEAVDAIDFYASKIDRLIKEVS